MILSFLIGLVVGIVFGLLKLPVPAPNKLEGILGIVGIFVGYLIISKFQK